MLSRDDCLRCTRSWTVCSLGRKPSQIEATIGDRKVLGEFKLIVVNLWGNSFNLYRFVLFEVLIYEFVGLLINFLVAVLL